MDWKQAYQEVYRLFEQAKKQEESPDVGQEEEVLEGRRGI